MFKNKIKTVRVIKRPTPVRNAVLVFSVTCNLFFGAASYAVYEGKLARTNVVAAQPVVLHGENYISTLEREQQ